MDSDAGMIRASGPLTAEQVAALKQAWAEYWRQVEQGPGVRAILCERDEAWCEPAERADGANL